jgi:formate hydrogenlyase subunit 6/NADH:ubiquinone oxidoreductase subunit I
MLGLDQLVDILTRLENRAISVHPQQCSRVRHRQSTCTRCADACPTGAITWADSLQVDADKCTGCGVCAALCPTGALEVGSPDDAELLAHVQARLKAGRAIAFACPRYLETADGDRTCFIPVACLGRLDEAVLVGAVSLRAEAVWLLDGACAACPQAGGGAVAAQAVQRANALLAAWGREPRIRSAPELPDGLAVAAGRSTSGITLSRRAFFSLLGRQTSGMAATAAVVAAESILGNLDGDAHDASPSRKGALPARPPAGHRLLLAALRGLGQPVVARLAAHGSPWAQFAFQQDCTGCQMCAFFCPTGALSKIQNEHTTGVAFRLSHCTGCGLCRDICYKQAVILSPDVDTRKVLDDAVDVLWMREADTVPWLASPEEKLRRLIEITS